MIYTINLILKSNMEDYTKMGKKTSSLQFLTVILSLITAVILLLHSLTNINACTIFKNIFKSDKSEETNNEVWEPLYESLKELKLEILRPENGAVVTDFNITIRGTIEASLPSGYRFYVLLKDKTNYFLQYPAVKVNEAQNEWLHNYVRFGSNGRWKIMVCLANKKASSYFENMAKQNSWGFSQLPDGAQVIKHINVTKK